MIKDLFLELFQSFFYGWPLKGNKSITSHCSKSSFFVQKFNFDFPRKLSIFY
eukprot:02031.XXX_12782_12937_1 [CDS] Oithona nana genome sequencing.